MAISFKEQLLTLIDKPIIMNTFKKRYIKYITVKLPNYSSSGDWNNYFWSNVFSTATFYIHFAHEWNGRTSYDVSGFRFDKDGYFKNYQTGKFLHEEFVGYITSEQDMNMYETLAKEIINEWDLCPLTSLPSNKQHKVMDIMYNINYFDKYTMQDRLDYYQKTNDSYFLPKEVNDVFVF